MGFGLRVAPGVRLRLGSGLGLEASQPTGERGPKMAGLVCAAALLRLQRGLVCGPGLLPGGAGLAVAAAVAAAACASARAEARREARRAHTLWSASAAASSALAS